MVIVRQATWADAKSLAGVALRSITVTGSGAYDLAQIAQWASTFTPQYLASAINSTLIFVVEDAGAIAGFANLRTEGGERSDVDLLYVDPDFSGHGVARLAVHAVESEARRQGVSRLWVDASLLAAPVFEHLGYDVIERYVKVRGSVTFANTWLAKFLAPDATEGGGQSTFQ
jgi:putative acetyltransferase